ncbi:MAG: alpha/beta hydrolase [Clostridia bacterium]|nr:alpha/beta hydrolase [Clostridia bacterium]
MLYNLRMITITDLQYSQKHQEKLDVYLPDSDDFTTVVYFHGGGLKVHARAKENFVEIAHSFVKQGYAFISADYRIYPEAKFPDFLEDGAAAVAFIKAHIPTWGGNGKIIVSGQSAGAWIAAMLCLDKKYLGKVGVDSETVDGWIIDSAQLTAHFNVLQNETGAHPFAQRINEYAPLYYVNENTKFSKMLLVFYEKDMPMRPEQNALFYKTVLAFNKDADIEYVQLSGGHVHGSEYKDDDGEYAFVKTSFAWLAKKGL